MEETTTEYGFLNLVIEAFCKNGIWKQVAERMSKGLASVLERIEKISLAPVQVDFWEKEFCKSGNGYNASYRLFRQSMMPMLRRFKGNYRL